MQIIAGLLAFAGLAAAQDFGTVHKPCSLRTPGKDYSHVTSPLPHEYLSLEDLPTTVDPRINASTTTIRNQHLPQYCGSCWAFGTTSALSDRLMMQRGPGMGAPIQLAPQVLVSDCSSSGSCDGGDPLAAYKYIHENGITDETCAIYKAKNEACSKSALCSTCEPGGAGCHAIENQNLYWVDEYGSVTGEANMKAELAARGPISCGVCAPPLLNYTGGVFSDKNACTTIDHEISVIGYTNYGSDNTPVWIVRNSWGSFWGDNGYAYIERGSDIVGIESGCSWATISVRKPTNAKKEAVETESAVHVRKPTAVAVDVEDTTGRYVAQRGACSVAEPEPKPEHVVSKMPHEYIRGDEIPKTWNWANVSGVNYLSSPENQHTPVYCGSCWAHGSLSALNDRWAIANANKWPHYDVEISTQHTLNCQEGGSCEGGSAGGLYAAMHEGGGIPSETCAPYEAVDGLSCDPTCKTYWGFNANVTLVTNEKLWYVSEFGPIHGEAKKLQAEIMARGPIACGIDATSGLEAYTGGIYSEYKLIPMINHIVSIVGWEYDEASGKTAWVVRNSWGTPWGEAAVEPRDDLHRGGFFRILLSEDGSNHENLAIQSSCYWGVPTTTDPSA